MSNQEKEKMISLLKAAGVTVSHWGEGSCMIKANVIPGVYATVKLEDLSFEDVYVNEPKETTGE